MTPETPMFKAADRNKDAILPVLRDALPSQGTVLEIASGGGQHISHFSAALPHLEWQPSERDGELVEHLKHLPGTNVHAALQIDVSKPGWQDDVTMAVVAVTSANMIHIAPWQACTCLLDGSARLLDAGGLVYFYGPFIVGGAYSSEGNQAFDRSLRAQNPDWGLRDLEQVCDVARKAGFELDRTIDMPANNLSVIFRRNDT